MRRTLAFALTLAALVQGCGDAPLDLGPAGLEGAYEIAPGGEFLFATSTNRNELRALDMAAARRGFVRAPNPLHPLSIPVVDRPVALGRDVRYVEDRIEGGQYVYVRSAAAPAVSVVSADRVRGLKEVARIPTQGVVTAVAGLAPETTGTSALYFTTWQGLGSALYEVVLPPVEQLATPPSPRLVTSFPGRGVNAILALPAQGSARRLVVALREQAGRAGSTVLVDVASGASRPLGFPAPVRLLATHPRSGALAAGALVYGVLDEESCGGGRGCSGVLAVDTATLALATDFSGRPMLPVFPIQEGALIRGLEIASEVTLTRPNLIDTSERKETWPLLGMISHADPLGRIVYFDARGLRHIDTNTGVRPTDPTCVDREGQACPRVHCEATRAEDCAPSAVDAFELLPATGGRVAESDVTVESVSTVTTPPSQTVTTTRVRTVTAIEPLPRGVQITQGRTRDMLIELVYQGGIPGLALRSRSAGPSTTFQVPPEFAARALPGDVIELHGAEPPGCPTLLPVATVTPAGQITAGAPIPQACQAFTLFTVRAAGAQPFVIFGSESVTDSDLVSVPGYMGRVGLGEAYVFQGEEWHRAAVGDPSRPELSFTMGRGLRWTTTETTEVVRVTRRDVNNPNEPPLVERTVTTVESAAGEVGRDGRLRTRTHSLWSALALQLSNRGDLVLPSTLYFDKTTSNTYVAYPLHNRVVSYNASTVTEGTVSNFVTFE